MTDSARNTISESMPLQSREMLYSILERALGAEKAAVCLPEFSLPATVSVRCNPEKVDSPENELQLLEIKKVSSWCEWGRDLSSRPVFTLDPLFHAGCYYVQDSSAMFPGMVFRKELAAIHAERLGRPLRVLDLCAAPGGKSTDLASSLRNCLGDNFILVSNEVMKARASVLADNMALWGDPNVVITSCDPAAFASLEGFFDIILADVPCSGEGMFRKDARAREDWSPELVELCAARQKRILADVWPSLCDGGILVYSTCTFSQEENEGVISAFLSSHPDFEAVDIKEEFGRPAKISCGVRITPIEKGEGHFAAKLRKKRESDSGFFRVQCKQKADRQLSDLQKELGNILNELPEGQLSLVKDKVLLLPEMMPDITGPGVLRAGVLMGEMKKQRFEPAHALFMAVPPKYFKRVLSLSADDIRVREFLQGYEIDCDTGNGYTAVAVSGLTLGFGKCSGGRLKNKYPKGLRI